MTSFMSKEKVLARAQMLGDAKRKMLSDVANQHVKLQKGNRKTGIHCWTVSLLPVVDCANCKECMWHCYDLRSDMRYPNVINSRARNSAIHEADLARFWGEIDAQIKVNKVKELRLNVGGDFAYRDFTYIKKLGENNPDTMIMFFTKNYKELNAFLDTEIFPSNVHTVMSAWFDMPMDNPHHLPCSHVLYEDGKTTAPQGCATTFCGGNCSECAANGTGCWTLKKDTHLILKVH